MVANQSTLLSREFVNGPLDGLVRSVPTDVPCFLLTETNLLQFGNAQGYERFCYMYLPDGQGWFWLAREPIERLSVPKDAVY